MKRLFKKIMTVTCQLFQRKGKALHKTNLRFAITCAALLALVFSSLPQQVEARGLQAPEAFGKSTPINLSAFLSVWTITLTWQASVGATEYEYCYDKTNDNACDSPWTSAGASTSVEIVSLDTNTTYYWQARAVNAGETTEANGGNWWAFTTGGAARFHVELVENHVQGYDWRPGNSVTMSIDDPSNGTGIDFTDTKVVDSSGTVTFYGLGGLQVGAGMSVTMTDGTVAKSHTVTSLQVTGVDVGTDIVSGTGEVGARLNIQHCQYNGCLWRRWATVGETGTWQVNFSVVGAESDEQEILDIVPGTSGAALQPDTDADHTDVNWYTAQKFDARTKEERVEGAGWALGATLTVNINDPATSANPDYTDTATVTVAPWDASQTWFNLDFLGQYDLKTGDVVTVTDGTTTKTHTATGLQITSINPTTNVVSGTAAAGSYVDLWVCGESGCTNRTELAGSGGAWSANFGAVGDQPWEQTTFDILSDTQGDSKQWDNDVDGTAVQWGISPEGFGKSAPANSARGVPTPVTLSWNGARYANSYQYCYDASNDNACSTWVNNGSATSKTLTGLLPNKTYYWQVRAVNAKGATVANNGTWWSFTTAITKVFYSDSAQDGWVLESRETGNVGGALNSTATTFNLGDNAAKRQYRGILSFATGASLPDNAVITGVTLKVRKQAILGGGDPLTTFQGLMADIKKGFFGIATLQASDFQATPSKSYGPFNTALAGGWYSINLTAGKGYINKLNTLSGLTQIRLRFNLDDNNNAIANYLSLYSGNAPAAYRPQLVITYYTP